MRLLPAGLFCLSRLLLGAQDVSVRCSQGLSSETLPVLGPAGHSVVARVTGGDDGAKDHHDCMADFKLVVQSPGLPPITAALLSSDAEWGRQVSIHLEGFSQAGDRVFGLLLQGGRFPFATLFEVDATTGSATLIELKGKFTRLKAVKCGTSFAVVGTTASGAIALKPDTGQPCQTNYRWEVDPASGQLHRLPRRVPITRLYGNDGPLAP